MRFCIGLLVVTLLLVCTCPAQLAPFAPCKFGKASTIGHADGITEQRVSFFEPSGEAGASIFVPDSQVPVPGIIFSHSAIRGVSGNADLLRFAFALARAGAASIVLDGTIDWQTPNDESERPPHLMACAGQWLLLNAKLDPKRLAHAGPDRQWGGGDTPFCLQGESPCWHPRLWINFGQTSPAELVNTNAMLTPAGRLRHAQFVQQHLKLKEINPEWLAAEIAVPAGSNDTLAKP